MPSNANSQVLRPLLSDVADLVGAHQTGKTGNKGRQWHLSGVNRAIVVMAVSAWEAYVEHVVVEAVDAMKPSTAPMGPWPSLKASVSAAKGRFNTPNSQNVRGFVRDSIGLDDVTKAWSWQATKPAAAVQRLDATLKLRHQIAHGVHPRPVVQHSTAKGLPVLVQKLADCTDGAIRDYLVSSLGVTVGW
ncbi:MAG: HEPN domain-containing protein [Myxococcales bacterium]|jgi:hypothetical protein